MKLPKFLRRSRTRHFIVFSTHVTHNGSVSVGTAHVYITSDNEAPFINRDELVALKKEGDPSIKTVVITNFKEITEHEALVWTREY